MSNQTSEAIANKASIIRRALSGRSIVLVGIMGVGKSTIGKQLAGILEMNFADADSEIEAAANMTIPEIFEEHGEPYFRSGEQRVIARLLDEQPLILATGGGAFMDEATRGTIAEKAISIWLTADLDVLMKRVRRRSNRPLLKQDDPEAVMQKLLEERNPVYALADFKVTSRNAPREVVAGEIIDMLSEQLPTYTASKAANEPSKAVQNAG